MGVTEFMVAIELGSSRITGIAGKKNSDGTLQVLAYASEEASSCIRKGVIFNIDKTALSLTSIINKLEAALGATIAKAYVGIGGQSLRTVKNAVMKHLDEEVRITKEVVDELIKNDRETLMGELEVLDVVPQEYKVGTGLQVDPIGVMSNHIEGRFLNIVARTAVKQKIERCFEQAKIDIAGFFIAPVEMAKVVLTDAERRSGCALIDFGAETTTVQVYKDHILRHLVVIPLGGDNITKDICSLQIEESDAEDLKIKYASALTEQPSDEAEGKSYAYGDKCEITERKLNEIVEGRCEEIIANVWHQIKKSGYDDKLMSGIVVTGGASNMRNLQAAIVKKTGIEKFKIAPTINQPIQSVVADLLHKNGLNNTLLGLLNASRENCCEQEPIIPLTPEDEKKAVPGMLFDEDGENLEAKRAALAEKARLEEEARIAAAAAEVERQRMVAEAAERDRIAAAEAAAAAEEAAKRAEEERIRKEEERRLRRENSLFNKLSKKFSQLSRDILNDE